MVFFIPYFRSDGKISKINFETEQVEERFNLNYETHYAFLYRGLVFLSELEVIRTIEGHFLAKIPQVFLDPSGGIEWRTISAYNERIGRFRNENKKYSWY